MGFGVRNAKKFVELTNSRERDGIYFLREVSGSRRLMRDCLMVLGTHVGLRRARLN